jgi:acyl-CoA reductase-like NAD-dependent aldehyde dehydrogenase
VELLVEAACPTVSSTSCRFGREVGDTGSAIPMFAITLTGSRETGVAVLEAAAGTSSTCTWAGR